MGGGHSLAGIKLKINPYFLFFLILSAVIGLLLEVTIFFVCIVVHELAHAIIARGYNIPITEIEFYPFGGVARIEGLLEIEPEVEKRIAWAGPLANFFLVALALVIYGNELYAGPIQKETVLFFIQANLVLAFFNLLPALPLDGGKILRARLVNYCDYRKATELAARSGKVLSVLILLGGIIGWWYGQFNLSILLLSVFLFMAASREENLAVYVFLRSLGTKKKEMQRRGGIKGEYLVVNEEASLLEIFKLFSPHRYHLVRVVTRNGQHIKGELDENTLVKMAMKQGLYMPAKKLIKSLK